MAAMPGTYVEPKHQLSPFTCPRCDTLSPHDWEKVTVQGNMVSTFASRCHTCNRPTLWEFANSQWIMVYPSVRTAPRPNPDLPDHVVADYEEAADVAQRSPRGAAALLRLCVQKLCVEFGEPGENNNTDIGSLVAKGRVRGLIQRAMDTVRIAGNESVHPGELNVGDDRELVNALFDFVNLIAEEAISTPRRIEEMYTRTPESKREAVDRRDGREPTVSQEDVS
jgi:hypothetical protein